MNSRLWIKNNLWRCSYIIPLTTKYRMAGRQEFLKKALPLVLRTRVAKGPGKRRCVAGDTLELMKRAELHYDPALRFYYHIDESRTIAAKGIILGNLPLDYSRILKDGFHELADRAICAGGRYGANAKLIKEAVDTLHGRILRYLQAEGQEEAARLFRGMLAGKAVHFAEGLQRILFFDQILWQTRHRLMGLGRPDLWLGELYRDDMEHGILDREGAYALILDFLKCLTRHYEYKSAALPGDIGQIIVLGGLTEQGGYFCNDLTEMFLRAHRELGRPDPKILLRVSRLMPDALVRAAAECLEGGTGSPLFSNDDVVTDALRQFGFSGADPYAYCASACWEPFIPGRSLDQNNLLSFDLAKVLFDLLKETDLSRITSFRVLLKAYDQRLGRELIRFVKGFDDYRWAEDPLLSLFTDDCTLRAVDIADGGAVYNNYGFTTVGMGALCDSLLNIRELCFREKKYTLQEAEWLREEDFAGGRHCYADFRDQKKHFGHDDPDSIALVNHILGRCSRILKEHRNRLGGRIRFGLSSPDYILAGKRTEADFAGRRKGMPYATHISADDAVCTELIGFAAQLDYSGCNINGNVADFFVQPDILRDQKEKFVLFLKGAIRRGFFQLQMNIMDSATLIAAKQDPERYPDLIVRVWGFSAYFNDLPEEYKDRLIRRALEAEGRCA